MHPDFDRFSESYRDDVQRSIGFLGQDHDFFVRHKVGHLLRLTERWVGDPAGLTALDVGCGIGLTDRYLTDRFGDVHGVDVSPRSLAVAREAHPSVRYQVYDGATLPFPDGSVDVSFAIGVLHHVPVSARGAFVAEMARVTASGGLAVVFEHNPYNPLTRLAVDRCDFDEGVIIPSKRSTTRLFRANGVRVIEGPYVLFFPWAFPGSTGLERSLRWLPLGAQYVVAGRPGWTGRAGPGG
jgi:SAM-dependent methyltransferase